MFYGLGADGTVGANKNSIKIIGEDPAIYAQGYFVYDSKKSGSRTVSHLRFGPGPIRSTYLIPHANFVACHQFGFLEQIDVLGHAAPGAIFLLNSPYGPDEVWQHLPREVQAADPSTSGCASTSSTPTRSPARPAWAAQINTIMQTCFFAISGVLPREQAIAKIKDAIEKTYGKKGERGRAPRTSPRSTQRSRICTRWRSRRTRPTARRARRWCPTTRRRSCSR